MAKAYLKNKELLEEFKICKYENDFEASNEMIKYFQLMISKMSEKFTFSSYDDKKDSFQDAFIALWNGWRNFDDKTYNQIFPYYSEIIKRSFAMSHNKRLKHLGVDVTTLGF